MIMDNSSISVCIGLNFTVGLPSCPVWTLVLNRENYQPYHERFHWTMHTALPWCL